MHDAGIIKQSGGCWFHQTIPLTDCIIICSEFVVQFGGASTSIHHCQSAAKLGAGNYYIRMPSVENWYLCNAEFTRLPKANLVLYL